jgi:hypothetical protein
MLADWLRSIVLAIKEIAASQKATLIDLGKIVGLETRDGIHPKETIWITAVVQGIEGAMRCRGIARSLRSYTLVENHLIRSRQLSVLYSFSPETDDRGVAPYISIHG